MVGITIDLQGDGIGPNPEYLAGVKRVRVFFGVRLFGSLAAGRTPYEMREEILRRIFEYIETFYEENGFPPIPETIVYNTAQGPIEVPNSPTDIVLFFNDEDSK